MLRYFSGIVISMFEDGTGGYGGWFASPGFPWCSGLSGVSPTIFVLYSNDVSSAALSLTSSILSL